MGNDGGTIARGQDLHAVYNRKSPSQNHIDNLQHSLLAVCSMSSLPLCTNGRAEAVVSDFHGRLYLKEKVLETLLRKKSRSKDGSGGAQVTAIPHINGLNDFSDVHITWSSTGSATCPVTKDTKTPKSTFVYSRNCGCVVSKKLIDGIRAHRRISDSIEDADVSDACPNCDTSFRFNYDIVMLNPESDQDIEKFNTRNFNYLTSVLGVGHAKKPLKKEKSSRVKSVRKKQGNGKVSKP